MMVSVMKNHGNALNKQKTLATIVALQMIQRPVQRPLANPDTCRDLKSGKLQC